MVNTPAVAAKGRLGLLVVMVFAVLYAALAALTILLEPADDDEVVYTPGALPETVVWLAVQEVHPGSRTLDVDVTLIAGAGLVGEDRRLTEDITVDIFPKARQGEVSFPAGRVPGTVSVPLIAEGDASLWPFDAFVTEPLEVLVQVGGQQRMVVPRVEITDSVPGWRARSEIVSAAPGDSAATGSITLHRSVGTQIAGLVLCLLLACMATFGLVVATHTVKGNRPFYPPLVGWYAAMIFAVAPLRNLLPGAPPPGAWVDRLVVLWVLVGLIVAMGMYLYAWWKAGK